MKNNRGFTLISILLLLVSLFSGILARYSSETEKPMRVSVILPDSTSSAYSQFLAGASDAAKEHNLTLNILTTDSALTAENELSLIREEIEFGCDGILLQPVYTEEADFGRSLQEISRTTSIMMVKDSPLNFQSSSQFSLTSYDYEAVAESLCSEVLIGVRNSKTACSAGILCSNEQASPYRAMIEEICSTLQEQKIPVDWILSGEEIDRSTIASEEKEHGTNILICLDNRSLESAGDLNRQDISIYGFGNTLKCVSSLENKNIRTILFPDEYALGYRSISALASNLSTNYAMQEYKIGFSIITRSNMFREKNQRLLFFSNQ